MKLGTLQFTAGNSHDVKDVLQLAVEADSLGYSRFWLGEHYTNIDWNNPEPMLPIILGLTENIRVGVAGILIRLHSAFRVACAFKLLHSIFPDRIDLGIGGGVTANERAIKLLTNLNAEHFSEIDYYKKIEELHYYFKNETPLLDDGVIVAPIQVPQPPVWILSTSYRGLPGVLEHKSHLSRSLFHQTSSNEPDRDTLERFREVYFERHGEPVQINLAFAGVCAPTEAEAQQLYQQSSYGTNTFIRANIIGTPEQFAEKLHAYARDFGIDEFIFLDLCDEHSGRMWALEALSEVCSLAVKADAVL